MASVNSGIKVDSARLPQQDEPSTIPAPMTSLRPLSAAQRVFVITELLENVLVSLSLEDLFGVQRVNRKFKNTMGDSKALRRIMRLDLHAFEDMHDTTSKDILYRSFLYDNAKVRQAVELRG